MKHPAQLARTAGDDEAAAKFGQRAQCYRNLHNPANDFFVSKNDGSNWTEPLYAEARVTDGARVRDAGRCRVSGLFLW